MIDAAERFFAKVNWPEPANCWLWTGAKTRTGYGKFSRGGGDWTLGHRWSWEYHRGPIPEGLCVLHRCDVRNCVNPSHLFLGTQAENIHDCVRKGRNRVPRGEAHALSKLTWKTVGEIRRRAALGHRVAEMAIEYGMCHQSVGNVVSRRTWRKP